MDREFKVVDGKRFVVAFHLFGDEIVSISCNWWSVEEAEQAMRMMGDVVVGVEELESWLEERRKRLA